MRRAYRTALHALLAAAVLAGCADAPVQTAPAPVEARGAGLPSTPPAAPADRPDAFPLVREGSRWWPAQWADLPGWQADRQLEVWQALRRGCERPAPGWAEACADAARYAPADDAAVRAWIERRLQPYRIEALDGSGAQGLVTGYFEPLVDASRRPRGAFRIPLHAPPPDLDSRKPYWTRQQLDSQPVAQAALRGREIAYVADPLDALLLQVQGSGRLRIAEPDGRVQTVRLAFAAHNGEAYKSVGRWLVDRGELTLDQASWPAIRAWAKRNPKRVNELLWSNPRVVFFREEPLPDASVGPRGAQGVPLTPGRSIAVDPRSVPYGTPVWLDTTEPLGSTPLRRLVMAQDTGSAITGAVRADYFWGWGDAAEQQAGRMKQRLRAWALWPRA